MPSSPEGVLSGASDATGRPERVSQLEGSASSSLTASSDRSSRRPSPNERSILRSMSFSSSSRPVSPPSYSTRDLSPQSGSSTPSGVPELVSSSGSDSTREPSFDSPRLTSGSAPDAITRLEPGQAPLLFSSPQIIRQRSVFPDPATVKNRLDFGRDGVHLTLLQKFIFTHPPSPSLPAGKDGRVSGYVHITAAKEKTIEGIQVSVIGRQKVYLPSNGGSAEETDILRREVVLGGPAGNGKGICLKAGLNSFEFSLTVPATTMPHERTPVGSVVHDVRVQLLGSKSGLFGITGMSAQKDKASLKLVCVPCTEDGVYELALSRTCVDPSLGLVNLSLSSSQLTVGGPLDTLVHLVSPPPGLILYAVNLYIVQTVEVTSTIDPRKTHKLVRPNAYIIQAGDKGPYDNKSAVERMRKDGRLWENTEGGEGEWMLEQFARMPTDMHMRPTTHSGTLSALRVSSEIVVEIVCSGPSLTSSALSSSAEEDIHIVTVLREPLVVCSCCAFVDSVVLPDYQICTDRFDLPTDNCPCVCQEPGEVLEKRELAFRTARRMAAESAMGSAAGRSGDGSSPNEEIGVDGQRGRKIGESW